MADEHHHGFRRAMPSGGLAAPVLTAERSAQRALSQGTVHPSTAAPTFSEYCNLLEVWVGKTTK